MRSGTLGGFLLAAAEARPGVTSHAFLADGEGDRRVLTTDALVRQGRALAALMAARGAGRGPVLLVLPPGLDFLAALAGCFFGGVVAVPLPPADVGRPGQGVARIRAALGDCRPTGVMTLARNLARDRALLGEPASGGLVWMAREEALEGLEEDWRDPGISPDDLAFLQYTSGSTRAPRGVALSHANVLANLDQVQVMYPDARVLRECVSWLPPSHDMGLILGTLLPVRLGLLATSMDPRHFLEKPIRWLRAISGRTGVVSAAPDFAYDLCVRRTTPAERVGLDLSGWVRAISGAEPVRASTLASFAAAFGPHGFEARSLGPGYGLAEATVCISGPRPDRAPLQIAFDRAALAEGLAREAPGGVTLVGSGLPIPDTLVRIVDPASRRPLPPGTVGEIWAAGPQVARGYHGAGDPGGFGASPEPPDGRAWLRTGDLGFLYRDEVFVSGRLKDLIILHGRNVHPHDLEAAAEAAHPAVRPDGAGAFGIEPGGREEVVVAVARAPGTGQVPAGEILGAVLGRITAELGEAPREVLLVRPGDLPKTTSGKLRRGELRDRWATGALQVEARLAGHERAPGPPPGAAPRAGAVAALEGHLVGLWQTVLGRTGLGPDTDFFAAGGDSVRATELVMRIKDELDVEVPITAIFERPTPGTFLAVLLEAEARRGAAGAQAGGGPGADPARTTTDWTADPIGVTERAARAEPDLARVELSGIPTWLVFHPDAVQQVLQTGARGFHREGRLWALLRSLLGGGLLTADGAAWGRRRRVLAPPMAGPLPERAATTTARIAREELAAARAAGATALAVQQLFFRISFRASAALFFDMDPGAESLAIAAEMRTQAAAALGGSPAGPGAPAAGAAAPHYTAFVDRVLAELPRRELPVGPALATLEGPTEVRDEVVTLLQTGTSSVASMAGWALLELALAPEALESAQAELGRLEGPAEPSRVPWLEACAQEAIRLHPPIWLTARLPVADEQVMGRRIPARSPVLVVIRQAHRHPNFWREPARFDPSRFLPGGDRPAHPAAYVPFGMGPRACVGRPLSHPMALAIVAEVLRAGRPSAPPDALERPDLAFTQLPRADLELGLAWAPAGPGVSARG